MNTSDLKIRIYRASYVCTDNIFKERNYTDERIVEKYELVFFLTDGGHFWVNGKKYMITSGTGRFYRPGDRVSSYRFNDVYSIHFMMDGSQKTKEFLEIIPHFFTFPDPSETLKMVRSLNLSMLENDDFDCVFKLCELLSHIKSHILLKNRKDNVITSVKEYIDENFTKNMTLDSLSTKFYLHPVYLQRKFKQEYKISPTEYIIKVRINNSKNYLLSTNMTVEQIAYSVGFSYPSYFIKVFKKYEKLIEKIYDTFLSSINKTDTILISISPR